MPHFPRPFFRTPRNRWYVELDGKQINLGPDKDEAFRQYHQLMADRNDRQPTPADDSQAALTVAEVYDKFLSWCQQHREPLTYKGYREFIQGFITALKDKALMAAGDLRPFHILE
jgi:hypothetical protein